MAEETGLTVEARALFDLLLVRENVRKPCNLAIYLCRVLGGELAAGDDATDARWFSLQEIRNALEGKPGPLFVPPPLAVAHHLIRAWADSRS